MDINVSTYDLKVVKRLTRLVLSNLKKTYSITVPISAVKVRPCRGKSWNSEYTRDKHVVISIGRHVKFPSRFCGHRILSWEDVYVGLLTWCVMVHHQQAQWRKNGCTGKQFCRADCDEIAVRMLDRWRIDGSYSLIKQKIQQLSF